MSNRRAWAVAFLCVGLAACRAPGETGPVRWQHPDANEEKTLADERDCRRRAESEVDREGRRDRIFGDDGLARPGTYDAMMSRHDARQRVDRLTAECMRRRGYGPAPR
jgi:hypothetical protein